MLLLSLDRGTNIVRASSTQHSVCLDFFKHMFTPAAAPAVPPSSIVTTAAVSPRRGGGQTLPCLKEEEKEGGKKKASQFTLLAAKAVSRSRPSGDGNGDGRRPVCLFWNLDRYSPPKGEEGEGGKRKNFFSLSPPTLLSVRPFSFSAFLSFHLCVLTPQSSFALNVRPFGPPDRPTELLSPSGK